MPQPDASKKPGTLGKLGLSLFLLVFLGMGLVFVGLIGKELLREVGTFAWNETPCTILESGIADVYEREPGEPYAFFVRYRYEIDGVTYEARRHRLGETRDADYETVSRIAQALPPGASTVCFVDPSNPASAVLARGGAPLFVAPFLLVPLVFVAFGAFGLRGVWKRARSAPAYEGAPIASISSKARNRRSARRLLAVVFTILVLVGGGTFFGFAFPALKRGVEARSWPTAEARVLHARLLEQEGSESTTYRADVLYEYEVDGALYRSNRVRAMQVFSNGASGKRDMLRAHPAGSRTVCRYDPDDPRTAVLDASLHPTMLLGLIPFAMLSVGLLGWRALRRGWMRDGAATSAISAPSMAASAPSAVPPRSSYEERSPSATAGLVLRPEATRVTRVVALFVFALFWNGIISFLVRDVAKGLIDGEGFSIFLALFALPFVLVGLALIGLFFHQVLGLANPRPELRTSVAPLQPGRSVAVSWRLLGKTKRLENLRITLEGREEARYRRGTDTRTAKHVFEEITVVDRPGGAGIARGQVDIDLPSGLMHSFESTNNKILWTLRVRGEIARWPDVDEAFRVAMAPAESSA